MHPNVRPIKFVKMSVLSTGDHRATFHVIESDEPRDCGKWSTYTLVTFVLRLVRLPLVGFGCAGVRLVFWSLRSTVTFVICFHWSLLLVFSLHFSSSSAFLRSLFTYGLSLWSSSFSGTAPSGRSPSHAALIDEQAV